MTPQLQDAPAGNTFAGKSPFSRKHRLLRAAWGMVWMLFAAWTPPPLNRWRLFLLWLFGATVHPTARVYGGAQIWYPPNLQLDAYSVIGPGATIYCMNRIHIGHHAVISQRAHLCGGTHDITRPDFKLKTRPIDVGAHSWICAEAFVGPGVRVGEGAVLAARGAAFSDLKKWTVYRGNPAISIKERPRF